MNEHEATALLEALVEPLEVGTPPTEALVARGRRTVVRRRAVTVIGAAAAVAVTIGGVAALAGQDRKGSRGPDQTAPMPTHPPFRDLDGNDLLGFWQPVIVLGKPLSYRGQVGNLQFKRSEVVTQHGCAIFTGRFRLGNSGAVELGRLDKRPMKCPAGFAERNLLPDSTPVLRSAARLQIVDGLLTVFDDEWAELGIYERHWVDVQPGELIGPWAPVELFGEAPALEGMFATTMPLLRFRDDHFSADDGTNVTSGAFHVGESGRFDLVGDLASTLVGCIHTGPNGAPTGQCQKVRNPEVIKAAKRVQILDGVLTFYDAEGTAIGVYQRSR